MRFTFVLSAIFCCSVCWTSQMDTRLKKTADEYGYKTANLYELGEMIQDERLQSGLSLLGVQLRIPPFYPISSSQIISFLNENRMNIKQEWDELINSLSPEERSKMIANRQIEEKWAYGLRKLRERVKNTFHRPTHFSPLTTPSFLSFIKTCSSFIVRSTGMEDQIGLTNAGGNESIKHVPPAIQELFLAMGEVVASYFSEKSICQRLLAQDPHIYHLPITPLLIQEMVAASPVPLEVVIHTTEQSGPTPTLCSFNCGYEVVNSKGRSDLYYYFPSGTGHAILAKSIPHLTNSDRTAIAFLGAAIETHYQRATDIELLVTEDSDGTHTIHLVQARPIYRPDLIEPNYLSNLSEIPPKNVIPAETIVASGSYVRTITRPGQWIVARTLKEAEDHFLFKSLNKDEVEAIIVEREAEPNSHEATTFASCGILVMRVENLTDRSIHSLLELNSLHLDPQQGVIVKKQDPILISEGFITHPMPMRVSIESCGAASFPYPIVEHSPQSDLLSLFQLLKQSEEKEAIRALSSLLFCLQRELSHFQTVKQTAVSEDALEKMGALTQFAQQRALDALPSLKLPPNHLKRLAVIKPIEALFIQEEDPALENSYSVKSVVEKYQRRMGFLEKLPTPANLEIASDLPLLDALCEGLDVAMSLDLKKKWLDWISQLEKRERSSLSEMIWSLSNLDAFSAWMQMVFASSSSFDELYTEYKEAAPFLKKIKREHDHLSSIPISDWGRPDQFDGLMSHLPLEILRSEEWKHIFHQEGRLKQILALTFMSHFIDTFDDQFIKTLLKSPNYSSQEQKVYCFRKVVKAYFSLLQAWEPLSTLTQDARSWAFADYIDDLKTDAPLFSNLIDFQNLDLPDLLELANGFPEDLFEELPQITKDLIHLKFPSTSLKEGSLLLVQERFANIESFHSYVEKLEQGIETAHPLNEKELFPPPHFNVASEIFVNITKKQQKINLDGYTLAAFFTLIHQNINSILTNLAIRAGLDQFQRPPLLQSVEAKIGKLGFLADESGQRKSPSLIGVKCQRDTIALFYNLPLKVHGVSYEIKYHHLTEEVKLKVNLVSIDNSLLTIAELFEIGASSLKAYDISTTVFESDLLFSCTFNSSSQIEILDLFLQCMQELTSSKFKDPNQKMATESTSQFLSLTRDEKFKMLLENL